MHLPNIEEALPYHLRTRRNDVKETQAVRRLFPECGPASWSRFRGERCRAVWLSPIRPIGTRLAFPGSIKGVLFRNKEILISGRRNDETSTQPSHRVLETKNLYPTWRWECQNW